MDNNDFYSFDGCYRKPATSILDFEKNLNDNFYHTNATSVNECEIQALRNNSQFFLVNDVSKNSINNNIINCYIPKIENSGILSIADSSIIEKAVEFFESLFTRNSGAFKTSGPFDVCNNLLYNFNKTDTNSKCFKYSLDEKVYAPKNYYAYYKKPSLNINNLDIMRNIKNLSDYNNSTQLEELKSRYEELIKMNNDFTDLGALVNTFKNFICDPIRSNENLLDAQILELKNIYHELFNNLDNITADLSNINYLNSHTNDTIKALNNKIDIKKNALNSLLGFGGANNGKLEDTTFLTQFTIVENSILLIIIITAIFIYTKMNDTNKTKMNIIKTN